jgi:hypothetical protein
MINIHNPIQILIIPVIIMMLKIQDIIEDVEGEDMVLPKDGQLIEKAPGEKLLVRVIERPRRFMIV